jgi:DUF1680 family protein
MSLWDNIVNRKYYVTGGIGSGETSEGFGPDYSLRHNAYCESCSSCGEVFFQHKLCLMHHDAKYADLYEETLFNALLGSIDLPGENFYYQNPLDARRARYDWHGCPCCVGNIPRTLLALPTWMYTKDGENLFVNMFVGSSVNVGEVAGTVVEVVQKTDYPWSGDVLITLQPESPCEFGLQVRCPDHAVSELYTATPASNGIESLKVNGQTLPFEVNNGYALVRREWQPGDRIELKLPMKVQRVHGVEKIEATRGMVTLRRGPLIFCVESTDQNVDNTLSTSSTIHDAWKPDLLRGTIVLEGEWSDKSPLLAIPYFLRQNRVEQAGEEPPPRGTRQRGGCFSRVWVNEGS